MKETHIDELKARKEGIAYDFDAEKPVKSFLLSEIHSAEERGRKEALDAVGKVIMETESPEEIRNAVIQKAIEEIEGMKTSGQDDRANYWNQALSQAQDILKGLRK